MASFVEIPLELNKLMYPIRYDTYRIHVSANGTKVKYDCIEFTLHMQMLQEN